MNTVETDETPRVPLRGTAPPATSLRTARSGRPQNGVGPVVVGKAVKASVTIWPPKSMSAKQAARLRSLGFEDDVTASLRRIGYRGGWQPTERAGVTFGDFWKQKVGFRGVGRERKVLDAFSLPHGKGASP